MGRAKIIPWCRYCLDDTHESKECASAPEDLKSGDQRSGARSAPSPRSHSAQGAVEIASFTTSQQAMLAATSNADMPTSVPNVDVGRTRQQSVRAVVTQRAADPAHPPPGGLLLDPHPPLCMY